jgi:hypothetical protein
MPKRQSTLKGIVNWESYRYRTYNADKRWVGTIKRDTDWKNPGKGPLIRTEVRRKGGKGSIVISAQRVPDSSRRWGVLKMYKEAGYQPGDVVVNISGYHTAMLNMDLIEEIPIVAREAVTKYLEVAGVRVEDLHKFTIDGIQRRNSKKWQ